MKGRTKKLFALLFAVVLIMQFVPAVVNASEEAPYSLEYLNSIQDVAYVKYIAIDDDGDMTNQTMEVYDAFDLWLNENGSWSAIVKPFRDAFKAAGFIESLEEDTKEYDNQIRYLFTKEADSSYEIFEILSEKRAYSILNESAVVYILHTTIMLQNTKNDVSVEPSGNTSSSSEGFDRFVKVQSYTEGRFSDVSAGNWFASGVQSAYELGLMKGNSETTFNPNGDMTIAETLTIACRIHDIYHGSNTDFSGGSPWYQPYIDYAIQNGIIRDGVYPDYSAKAKRFQFANIIYASLPSETWTVLNSVTELPDVKSTDWFSSTVFALYNAGILTGSDQYGTFNPHSTIKRSEIATIATRVAVPSSRISFTLQAPPVDSQPDPVNTESNLPTATAEAGTPVTIAGVLLKINSVDGVIPTICWRNNSEKTIKYLTLTVTPYNAVDDPVTSTIGDISTVDLKITGPVDAFDLQSNKVYYFNKIASVIGPGAKSEFVYFNKVYRDANGSPYITYGLIGKTGTLSLDDNVDVFYDQKNEWNPVWYSGDVKYLVIEKAVVEYMDGSSVTVNNVKVEKTIIVK